MLFRPVIVLLISGANCAIVLAYVRHSVIFVVDGGVTKK